MRRVSLSPKSEIVIPGDKQATLDFAVGEFIRIANESIEAHGVFYVALSGGSTPKAIFQALASQEMREKIDWRKVFLFWSDERSVPSVDPDSNYKMAMDAGFSSLPIPEKQIFRMEADEDIEKNAIAYQSIIEKQLQNRPFDLIMLGMGEDGHTASLFPGTEGLLETEKLIIANHIPQKKTDRMTMTFKCINLARNTTIYVLGASKQEMLVKIHIDNEPLPISHVGTEGHKALWIADQDAAKLLLEKIG